MQVIYGGVLVGEICKAGREAGCSEDRTKQV